MIAPAEGDLAIEPLDGARHDRKAFSCGVASLDLYLKTQAAQDVRRKANAVFVMVARLEPKVLLGYFTLCATSLAPGLVPEAARKHTPRYPVVSATLLGRLAVASSQQGQGLGGVLLVRALRKAHENTHIVGASVVVVDAIDERASSFYAAHGFIRLPDSPRLILPMYTIAKLIGGRT